MKRRRNSTTPVVCKKAKINDLSSIDDASVNIEDTITPTTRKPLEKTPTTRVTNVNSEMINIYTVDYSFDSWKGDRDENQDQYYVTEDFNPNYMLSLLTQSIDFNSKNDEQTIGIFGVYDGHGPAGLEGAKITREKMPKFIYKNLSFLPSFAFSKNFACNLKRFYI